MTVSSAEYIDPGTMIGDYRVEEVLAEGGMGLIYAGIHPLISKRVAIKVISKQFAEVPKAVSRFVMEARSVNEIGHHNIVDIFSIGDLPDGRTYLIMELLDGLTLHDLLMEAETLPAGKVLPIYEQLCSTLEMIHQKGFAHRDLKPPNIFVLHRPPHPFVKILDFGLAKLWSDRTSENTDVGMVLGTPEYMSPEQCRGEEIDFHTDIYSLGVMLFELLTGVQPFTDPSPLQVLTLHMTAPVPTPSRLAPMSTSLEWVILKAMHKDPAKRFTSAAEMLDHLRLAVPDRLTWNDSRDFHVEPDSAERFPDEKSPIALPPDALQVTVPKPVATGAEYVDDEGDTAVSESRLRKPVVGTGDDLVLLEVDEEARTDIASGGLGIYVTGELDLSEEDMFDVDPVTPLLEVDLDSAETSEVPVETLDQLRDADLLASPEGMISPAELMEVNIDGVERGAIPGASVHELLRSSGEHPVAPPPEPVVELLEVKISPEAATTPPPEAVIELTDPKEQPGSTPPWRQSSETQPLPALPSGAREIDPADLDYDAETEVGMIDSLAAPKKGVVVRSRGPAPAVGKPPTAEWATNDDTELSRSPPKTGEMVSGGRKKPKQKG